jgi:D-alanyl-D-alanine carboxypeptidase/D-alanyl-D-alanine-endopeptidase (penicillin-binding protein 4)
MHRISRLLGLFVLCVHATLGSAADFSASLNALVSQEEFRGAHWGICIASPVNDNAVIFNLNADKCFVPASTIKLLTSAAALDSFGPDYRFETTFLAANELDSSGALRGDLIIRGSGDPSLNKRQNGNELPTAFLQIADSLWARGLQRICGHLNGDARAWQHEPVCPSWETGDIGEDWLPVPGALSLGRQDMSESSDLFVVQETTVGSAGPSPTIYFLSEFRNALLDAGISIPGCVSQNEARKEPLLLYLHQSEPLCEIIKRMNTESDNFFAEQLGYALGGGSRARGLEKIQAFLADAGLDTSQIKLADASGLSRKNFVTPMQIVRLLTTMRRHRFALCYQQSLAGLGEGTLEDRKLTNTQAVVRAKTGTLDHVSALSGYMSTPSGNTLAFSIICNHFLGDVDEVRRVQDEICELLAANAETLSQMKLKEYETNRR